MMMFLGCTGMAHARQPKVVNVRFEDLPSGLAKRFDRNSFPALIRALTSETARRKRDGDFDHLIAYALQSSQFTKEPKVEPAVSAQAFARGAAVPLEVQRRLKDFVRALSNTAGNSRLGYFAKLVPARDRNLEFLEREYCRTMRFLYTKEFLQEKHPYETRGYSTDTQVGANYAVWNALSVLKTSVPNVRVRRVLIIGPGMDLAPRTDLVDAVPPQSFQPYLIADALLSLRLASLRDLEIDCVDINGRVVEFINSFSSGKRLLQLYSPPGTAEYNRYFQSLGREIGRPAQDVTPAALPGYFLEQAISVEPRVAHAIHATELNITTRRLSESYDLAIATNVLLYFGPTELALALSNTAAMLRTGGYFIHNDLRPETGRDAEIAGFETLQARSVLVAQGQHAPLYDSFALNEKR
jgi:hypothetical protein